MIGPLEHAKDYDIQLYWPTVRSIWEDKMPKRKSKRQGILCPNCGRKVKYGSEHARGSTELDMYWVCKKYLTK